MSLSNTTFPPSRVEDRIYDLMSEEQYIANLDIQTESLFLAIFNMMNFRKWNGKLLLLQPCDLAFAYKVLLGWKMDIFI